MWRSSCPQSTYRVEMKYRESICPLSRSVHCNFVRDGNRLAPHPNQPGMIFPSWCECTPKIGTRRSVCTLWSCHLQYNVDLCHYLFCKNLQYDLQLCMSKENLTHRKLSENFHAKGIWGDELLFEALPWNNKRVWVSPEPVFLNVYGAQESIPRNEFRQPM